MKEQQRIKKVINWLIYNEVSTNERALSELLGYTKSSFSQIVNGRVPLSEKFVDKLCSLDENINKVWIMQGIGNMFLSKQKDTPISVEDITIPKASWEVIQAQAKSLSAKDGQIDELISQLKEQVQQGKKTNAQEDSTAECADAV